MPILLRSTCALMSGVWLGLLVYNLLGPEKLEDICYFFSGIWYDIKRFFRRIFQRKKKAVNSAHLVVPKELLTMLVEDKQEAIRIAVASNKNISKEMFKPNPEQEAIRIAVASNKNISKEMFKPNPEQEAIRIAVASNKKNLQGMFRANLE